ncbi:MAG: GNAT superfamily N-acetyltransferase [Planctomycetota bacterium]|jgi:GNAT superfamily N-acetyltransferase
MSATGPEDRASQSERSTALCGPPDRSEQAALYNLCFDKQDGERVLGWRYDKNPAGQAVSLLTRSDSGQPVSGYACSPRAACSRGQLDTLASIGQTGDVMTHPEWRGKGIFSDLDRAAMVETGRQGWPFVLGLPNRKSESIFTGKLGWKLVGRIRPWTFVLQTDEITLRERIRVSRWAAFVAPFHQRKGIKKRADLKALGDGSYAIEAIERFDDEVDPIFEVIAPAFPLIVRRNAAYLNWRFIDAPSGLFRALGVRDETGMLRAWCVVQLPSTRQGVGYLIDLLASDEASAAHAFEAGFAFLEKAECSVVRSHAIESSSWQAQLEGAGFLPGKAEDYKAVIAYIHDEQHPLGQAALKPESWFFTDGDRDDELVSG